MSIFDVLKKAAAGIVNAASSSQKTNQSGHSDNGIPAKTAPKETNTFVFNYLPKTLEEFKNLPEAALDTPFKTAALTVCALCEYAENREIGKQMLNFLKGPQPMTPYEEQFIANRFMDGKQYIAFSFFEGTSPDNDYTPTAPYKVSVSTNPYSYQDPNYALLFIHSSGADSDRQVKLRKKGNQWFLWEQFLLSDIRKPKSQDPWA